MCGIGGVLRTDGEAIPDEWLDAIDARIAPRGPDGHGRFRDRVRVAGRPTISVGFVHRRLSILDHAGGAQPMVSVRGRSAEEGKVAVVFNGCIYNHRELRAELEALGHRFTTDHSDTEVLVHGHREWGEQFHHRLEGMYAYAIWDRRRAALMLARDWFGEKPLFVWRAMLPKGEITIFGSDARAIGSLRMQVEPTADLSPPVEWVQGFLQLGYGWRGETGFGRGGPRTETVRAIAPSLPAHLRDPAATAPRSGDPGAFAEAVETHLDRAVARRLDADVPLGCFLSGGVDSSLIAAFAHRHKPDLHTFSVRMPDPRYDESAFAERVAAHLGTTHTTLEASPRPAEDTVMLVERLGRPFADSSILPTYWVSKAAREHVTVALSGDGADELFVGYERYVAARALDRWHGALRLLPRRAGASAHPKSVRAKAGRLGHMAREYRRLGVLAMESIFTQDQITRLLGAAPDAPASYPGGTDALAALRAVDVISYLPGDLLAKVDTASMAVALEVRCPYLDRDLATLALTVPLEWHTPAGRRKGLLREIARRHVPPEAIDRPKMGFAIPIGHWFRTDHGGMKGLLLDQLNSRTAFGPIELDRREIRRTIDDHLERRRDHGHRLFALLTLSLWAKGR